MRALADERRNHIEAFSTLAASYDRIAEELAQARERELWAFRRKSRMWVFRKSE